MKQMFGGTLSDGTAIETLNTNFVAKSVFTTLQRMTQRTKNGADNPRRMKDKNAKEWLDIGPGKVSIRECMDGRASEWELTES